MRVTEQREPYTRHSVTLDAVIVGQAQKHGINISLVCREALSTAVRAAQTKKMQTLQMEP